MQSIQPQVVGMREHQFFNQGIDQPGSGGAVMGNNVMPMGPPGQMFGNQMNQNGLLNPQQQQQQQQQGNMPPSLPGFNQGPEQGGNGYIMGAKVAPILGLQQQQQQLPHDIHGLNSMPVQPPQGFNGGAMGVLPPGPMQNNAPPGLNVMQQGNAGVGRQVQMPLANNMNVLAGAGGFANGSVLPPMILPPLNHMITRDVWKDNLHNEFVAIRRLIKQFNYVSVSTEFIGTMARPIGNFETKADYHYQTMRSNVDLLNPVQMAISLSDANGNKPDNEPSTWQFNFQYDVDTEMISGESLELLKTSGVNLDMQRESGVDKFEFAQLMMDSGLIMEPDTTWITYHAAYDIGFLVHILMNDMMPATRQEFEQWVVKLMPSLFDLNLIYNLVHDFKNPQQPASPQYSLNTLGDEIGIPRLLIFTTTGGQALLMILSFCYLSKICMNKLPDGSPFSRYKNVIYGINDDQPPAN
ncbi:CCR4-NOT core DEDD family RNase subunit [Maudiozyma humilis]|uniref:poly(A)-specific ribonuclease n=1 Tax=Maudiozyma humilis TaxID=51915 RepID=A0AAV5RZ33_MAUHU|nr:CCR4-NOT core DEDD family RNase subunit [Kazachstania humilis]